MDLKIIRQFVAHHWKIASQELWDDLRTTKWTRGFGWFWFFTIIFGGPLAAVSVVALAGENSSPALSYESSSPCVPDGSFIMRPDLYNPWTTSGAFEITLAFGDFSFANAKLIDVVWDAVSP